jgi:hypothetical protein
MRNYNPDLDNVYVARNGTIRWDGDEIGFVEKTEGLGIAMGKWRAEVGDAAKPEEWPRYRVSYAPTRKAAIGDVLDGIEVPS